MNFAISLILLLASTDAFVLRPGRNSWSHRTTSELSANTVEGIDISGALEPLSNFVLVKVREAAAQTLGGIVLPDQAKEKPSEGTVVSAGPGKVDPTTNVIIPMPVAEGARVLYGKFDGSSVDYNGAEHTLIRDEDILISYTGEELTLSGSTPMWDRILVKVAKEGEATASGIMVAPTSGGSTKPSEGEVVSVGTGKVSADGSTVPMSVSVGEWVKFRDYAGSEVRIEGADYILVKAGDCLAKWTV